MSIRGLTLTKIFGVLFLVVCVALGVQTLRADGFEKRALDAELKVEAFTRCANAIKIEAYSPDCPSEISDLFIAKQNLKSQLIALELKTAAAIARAEVRATDLQSRKSQNEKFSKAHRAMLLAALFATLNACASVPRNSPEPIIRVQTVFSCPPELSGEIANMPSVPDGAVLTGNDAGQKYHDDVLLAAFGFRLRLVDAQAVCRDQANLQRRAQ